MVVCSLFRLCCIISILIIICLTSACLSLLVSPAVQSSRVKYPIATRTTTATTTLFDSATNNNNNNDDDNNAASIPSHTDNDNDGIWKMNIDWILMDQLPKFTVGQQEDLRTFWAQLIAATPELARFDEKQLTKRCQTLSKTSNKILFGPSPPLLQNWSTSSKGVVTGMTQDGRTIWVTAHVIGRLSDDPLSSRSNQNFLLSNDMSTAVVPMPGGYVEAIGGRVYELGQPHPQWQQQQQQHEQNFITKHSAGDSMTSTMITNSENKANDKKNGLGWWIPATTATMSALIASTILSACIGYGAGLSMIADESHNPTTSLLTPTTTINVPSASGSGSSSVLIRPSSSTSSYPDKVEMSASEQRARVEARVLREQRMVKTISERLQQDEIRLNELRIQEQQQQKQQLP